MGQDAGLISDIPPAGEVVTRIAEEAEQILRRKLPALVARNLEHDPEKWIPVSRLREALGTIRRLA